MKNRDFVPGTGLFEKLVDCGVPEDKAKLWAQAGRAQSLHLTWDSGVYLWEVHRDATRQLRLDDHVGSDMGILRTLVRSELDRGRALGFPVVKSQLSGVDMSDMGFDRMDRPVNAGQIPGYIAWLQPRPKQEVPVYLRQRTDFTCGPASIIMGSSLETSVSEELDVWRHATYGIGTDPYGLGAAAVTRGVPAAVRVSRPGLLLHEEGAGSFTNGQVRQEVHEANVQRALSAGADVQTEPFNLDYLRRCIEESHAVVVLIDEKVLNAETAAHWVLAWGAIGDSILVHDPWTDDEVRETWVETCTMPVASETMWQMAAWGDEHVRALVTLGQKVVRA